MLPRLTFKSHWVARYAAAMAAAGVGFLIRLALTALVGEGLPAYITFYPFIMAVALLGGFGPGLLATLASALAVDHWLLTHTHAFGIAKPIDAVGLAFFACTGVFISTVAELYRRSRHKAAAFERQAALRESEGFKQAILDSLPAHVAVIDERGIVSAVNKSWQEFARRNGGLQAERVSVGSDYLGVCRRAAAEADAMAREALEGIEGVLAGRRGEFTLEYPCHSPTQQRWFLMSVVRPIGGVRGAVVMHLDISERKRSGEELRRNEERLKFALETSHTGAWELDLGDHSARRSLEHDRIFGYAELLPRWTYEMFLDHVLPEDRPMVDDKFRRAVETGGDWNFECRIRRSDQQERWIWAAGRHRTDAAGVRRGMTGIVQDITERKQAETAVLQLNSELRQRVAELQAANEEVQSSRRAALSLAEDALEARKEAERVNADLQKANKSLGTARRAALNLMDDAVRARHQAEKASAELEKANRILKAQAKSDQALVRAQSEADFMAAVCRIVVEDCGHALVWVGLAEEDEAKTVRPAAQAGFEEGYLETLRITWADTERGRGPTGTAIRTGQPSRCRNMHTDPRFAPWRDEAIKRGYASSLVLPLLTDGEAFGALSIYSSQPDGFGNDEVTLLTKLAGDLAYGITELRLRAAKERAEEALRQSEERYRGLVELSPEGLFVNRNDRIVLVNPAALLLFGASSAEQLLGKSPFELFHPDFHALMRERIGKLLAGQRASLLEEKIVRLDGVPVDVEVVATPVMDQGERAILVLLRDITERKQTQAALQHTAAELERSNRDLEQFAYVASHDLQEPLRAVGGYVKLLQHRFPDKLDAKAQGYIAGAFEGATRMERLITDLLAYSRVGTHGGNFVPTDLDAVLNQALGNLQVGLESSRAKITRDPLPTLAVDATQMMQLFQNLVGNALKFHGESPPSIHVGAQRQDGRWLISVRDNGIGIEPQYFGKIFQVFQRLHTRKDYPGTGIGLAICKKIVERHGGTIWVESQPGQGSTFNFTIPEAAR
jgi:PAS domain S-box-containing protein